MSITIERIYFASVDESNAINAASDKSCNQKLMAEFYADCIRADVVAAKNGTKGVNWIAVNRAISARWPKGLTRIKTMAWRILSKNAKKVDQ